MARVWCLVFLWTTVYKVIFLSVFCSGWLVNGKGIQSSKFTLPQSPNDQFGGLTKPGITLKKIGYHHHHDVSSIQL